MGLDAPFYISIEIPVPREYVVRYCYLDTGNTRFFLNSFLVVIIKQKYIFLNKDRQVRIRLFRVLANDLCVKALLLIQLNQNFAWKVEMYGTFMYAKFRQYLCTQNLFDF